jgi:DNA-binding beta-propeller fold protein YncE
MYFTWAEALQPVSPSASLVYSQQDLTSQNSSYLTTIQGLAVAPDGTLFVCDSHIYFYDRVVAYSPSPPSFNDMPPVNLWGQSDFDILEFGPGMDQLFNPFDVEYDPTSNSIIVADYGNSRVQIFQNAIVPVLSVTNIPSLTVSLQFLGIAPNLILAPLGK